MYISVYKHEDGRTSVCVGDIDHHEYMIQDSEYPKLEEWEIPVTHIKTLSFEQFHEPGLEVNTVNDTPENVIKKIEEHFDQDHSALDFLNP